MRSLVATLTNWGPWGLFTIAFTDSAGIPIPAGVDALLIYLSANRPADAWWLALLAVIGSLSGSAVMYKIARKGGEAWLDRKTKEGRGARLKEWFHHYGLVTVLISAMIPLPGMPMKFFVFCSGALGVSLPAFLGVIGGARALRYATLAFLGAQLGHDATAYLKGHVGHLALFALGVFLACFGLIKYMDYTRVRRGVNAARS